MRARKFLNGSPARSRALTEIVDSDTQEVL
jgi:hypothetical protein